MSRHSYIDLADCSEFRQTLAARPPRIVHGAVLLLVALLVATVTWSALVKANLVVRAIGRVRPAESPTRVFTSGGADLESRVVEAPFEIGDAVRQGDVLVRLDTAHIDNRIAKLERTMEAAEEELAKLTGLQSLLELQLDSAKEKARSELAQAESALTRAADRRASDIRRGQVEVRAAKEQWERARQLAATRAITREELTKLETALHEAEEKLVQAELPVDAGPVAIARQGVDLVDRDFAVRRAELEARVVVKRGEAEGARKELANLNIQRGEAVLRSPVDGVVVAGRIEAGDVLAPGKPVLEIAQQRSYRFEALVPSEDVGQLRVGMPVRVKFDAYDYQKYGVLQGTVVYLSPDSKFSDEVDREDEVASRPAVRKAPAAFVVRVELHADEVGRGTMRGPVKLGLGGMAEIVTGRESVLSIFLKQMRHSVSLG